VGRDDVKSVNKKRDQVPKHMARAREAMQKQQLGRAGRSSFAIEELETVDIGRAISDRRHQTLLSLEKLLYLAGRRFSWAVNPSCWSTLTAPVFLSSKSLEPSRRPMGELISCPRSLSAGNGVFPRPSHKSSCGRNHAQRRSAPDLVGNNLLSRARRQQG